ncbi:serine O-acetyltransferase EpsC [Flavobacterium psychrotolerans]|uniref:Serine acetyltransferase n=1 Tax=Flavobacterium psychrotolerans TaxID=2169410 RepID=A0A2U1JQN9_9FLAO|nr:serine O-acetyltransferase EpsC [Flavobacterium psychrotolerans]PWA07325.1 serine acetyltransferase [Flavobacterium psychrotolerans]
MTKDQIINTINSLKGHSSINYGIKTKTETFTEKLFYTLFDSNAHLGESIDELEKQFKEIAALACKKTNSICDSIWDQFLKKLPIVLEKLNQDADYFLENDPASNSIEEVYLAYPGFYAIAIYRLSHELYLLDLLLFSRLMSEYAHRITGTDIHAGATIASPIFIDHATGIVIGETTIIEKYVKIYQGVTLGALSITKDMKNSKRHPTVEENVCIYANATILGGTTTIGKNSIIGGNSWVTKSIPAKSIVTNTTTTEVKIKEKK